jgi:hypothetical protein
MSAISEKLQEATRKLVRDAKVQGTSMGQLLNTFLGNILPTPYCASSGRAIDSSGVESAHFNSLIYTSKQRLTSVPADQLACAIDVFQSIGKGELRESYSKIAQLKGLQKSPRTKGKSGMTPADATMGIVLSLDSDVPLEVLAGELAELNKKHSHHLWVDMVAVLSRGIINYVCQFPDKPPGIFLPPARNNFMLAPMYVAIFAQGHPAFSLNKMFAVLLPYLYFFCPDIAPPNHHEILEGVPTSGISLEPYQFNLKGELAPVPNQLRFNQFSLFPLGFRAEDRKGNILARVQYLPWQDGCIVRVSGKLPIEAFLIFAGKEALSQPVIRLQESQLSGVLPLSREQFIQMAERTARQSNLVIKPDERPKWVVENIGNEGTSSPFIARLFLGVLNLRNQAKLNATQLEQFDKAYERVMVGVDTIRTTAKTLIGTYASHCKKIEQGQGVKISGNTIHVTESINKELRRQVEEVIGNASALCKDRVQGTLRILSLEIGFLFKKAATFERELTQLRQHNNNRALADYLEQTRIKWLERLVLKRNAIEHGEWSLPRIQYVLNAGKISVTEPLIDDRPVTEFIAHMVDRVCCFAEELTVSALQAKMPEGISVTEIPIARRNADCNERFQLALLSGGLPIWTVSYHDSKFEDT